MPFEIEKKEPSIIKVVGVGGGGGNAVNHMYRQGITDVDFVVCNTDAQVLEISPVPTKIQLGASLTEGRGAGNKPEQGKQAAIESLDEVMAVLTDDTKMVFITAGLGGGTGTGAAPVIAKAAKEAGILTVGIVTLPFRFEGLKRVEQALVGLQEMSENVDSLLVIDNEKLREIYGDLTISNAFAKADDILTVAAKGIAEIITVKGYINVDFEDVKTVMKESGVALMGAASASGEGRAQKAIEDALQSPLLNSNDINGAKNVLLNFMSGVEELTMDEIVFMNQYVQDAAGNNANLIWGHCKDESIGDKIAVTVIATGFKTDVIPEIYVKNLQEKKRAEELNKFREEDTIPMDIEKPGEEGIIIVEETKVKSIQKPEKEPEYSEKQVTQEQEDNEKNSSSFDPTSYRDHLEEYERVPAYVRKGLKIQTSVQPDYRPDDEVSNYYVGKRKPGYPNISKGNPYLDDNVD